jgi:DNA invertase Pin-like site-specific DNA recombinase
MQGKFVTYFRVSTAKQGQSGLGLDAQKEAVQQYLNGGRWEVIGEFIEVETGKGSDALEKRPQLREALAVCKKQKARLLIAKLDRLARNVHFVSGLMESKVSFVALDIPEANDLTIHIMAAFAQHEAQRISERTKAALAASKARGTKLGAAGPANLKRNVEERVQASKAFAEKLRPVLAGYKDAGLTQEQQVSALNELEIKTPRGSKWTRMALHRVIQRLKEVDEYVKHRTHEAD